MRGESPALGVLVASCPGDAVCVRGTVYGSPADEAGIREGDYILALNGLRVTSPEDLRQAVAQSDRNEQATVVLWRDGEEINKRLYLAARAEKLPASEQAWLGVQLQETQEGVALAHVLEYGPADQAGLQDGDIVLELNGEEITTIDEFVERVADFGPGQELELLVRRNDERRRITAELNSIDEAPMAYLRHAFGTPSWQGRSATSIETDALVDATLDVLRQQIRELQQQVEELNSGQPNESNESEAKSEQPGEIERKQPDSADSAAAITLPLSSLGSLVAVPQRGNRGWRNDQDWDDWRQRLRNAYRNNRSYYNPYNNYYNYTPYYRSPYYGNSYYRYGGRPYYYNWPGGYGYGLRNGLRIGPNFGMYWY